MTTVPDLDPLPPRPYRPSLRPRPGDLDDLRGRVARRRRKQYATAGGAVAAAAVVAVFVAAGGGGALSLRPLPARPANRPSASPSAVPSPSDSPTQAPQPTGSVSPSPTPALPRPSATAAPSPSTTRAGTGVTAPYVLMKRTDVAYTANVSCQPSTADSPGWCIDPVDGGTMQSAFEHDFVAYACRVRGSGDGRIELYTREELAFEVSDESGKDVFTYRGDYMGKRTGPTVTVRDGRCAKWVLTWDVRANDGRPLAPATYGLGFSIDGQLYANGVGGSGSTGWGTSITVVD